MAYSACFFSPFMSSRALAKESKQRALAALGEHPRCSKRDVSLGNGPNSCSVPIAHRVCQ